MKRSLSRVLIVSALVAGALVAQAVDAVAPGVPVPVSVFTTNNLPAADGKPLWDGAHGSTITRCGRWVYAASTTEMILQFECDPATAKLTYKGAIPLGYHNKDSAKGGVLSSWVRHVGDAQDKLILFYGDHNKGVSWYGIDKNSGVLTFENFQCVAACDHHNATQLITPDRQHFCYGGRLLDKVDWYRFGVDGLPVADGSFVVKNFSTGNGGMSSGCVMNSPDWSHLYSMVFQCPDSDFSHDRTPFVETYKTDLQTHTGTYVGTLELPVPASAKGRVSGTLLPFSPDGRFSYAVFRSGNNAYYYTLACNPQSGTLSLATPSPTLSAGNLGGLTGAPWSRQGRFAYTADGKGGIYVNNGPVERFSRDPATGALTFLPPVPDMGAFFLSFDPDSGILLTVGEKIASFLVK